MLRRNTQGASEIDSRHSRKRVDDRNRVYRERATSPAKTFRAAHHHQRHRRRSAAPAAAAHLRAQAFGGTNRWNSGSGGIRTGITLIEDCCERLVLAFVSISFQTWGVPFLP